MLAVRLPEDIEKRLAALAKATGRTKSFYARRAIEEHLDELDGRHLPCRTRAGAHPQW